MFARCFWFSPPTTTEVSLCANERALVCFHAHGQWHSSSPCCPMVLLALLPMWGSLGWTWWIWHFLNMSMANPEPTFILERLGRHFWPVMLQWYGATARAWDLLRSLTLFVTPSFGKLDASCQAESDIQHGEQLCEPFWCHCHSFFFLHGMDSWGIMQKIPTFVCLEYEMRSKDAPRFLDGLPEYFNEFHRAEPPWLEAKVEWDALLKSYALAVTASCSIAVGAGWKHKKVQGCPQTRNWSTKRVIAHLELVQMSYRFVQFGQQSSQVVCWKRCHLCKSWGHLHLGLWCGRVTFGPVGPSSW